LPSRPEVNQPGAGVQDPPPAWLAWMPPLMFVWPSIMFWFMIRAQWRLLADGVPVPAVVTRIKRSKQTDAHYEFKIPAGEAVKGRSPVSRRNVPKWERKSAFSTILIIPGKTPSTQWEWSSCRELRQERCVIGCN